MATKKTNKTKTTSTATTPSKFGEALAGMQVQYNAAHDRYSAMDGADASDGEHIGRQIEAKLYFNEAKESLSIIRTFKVTEGIDKGCCATDFMNLSNDRGLEFGLRYISTLGYEVPKNAEDIESVVEQIHADRPFCSFKVKNGDFTNVTVLEAFDAADFEDISSEEQTGNADVEGDEDDIWADIAEYDKDELCEAMDAEEISMKDIGTTKMKAKKLDADALRELLMDFLGLEAPEEEEAEEAEEEEEEGESLEEELNEMDIKNLKAYVKDNDLGIKKTAKMTKEDFIAKILEASEEAGEEDEDEGETVKLLVSFLVANVEDVESTEKSSLDEVKEEVLEIFPISQDDFDELDEEEQELLNNVFETSDLIED